MLRRKTVLPVVFSLAAVLTTGARPMLVGATPGGGQIEPGAGTWRTWVLRSGSQLRVPPPPAGADANAELATLRDLATQRDAAALNRIAFWNAGAPGYRWNAILREELAKHGVATTSATTSRQLSLLDVAIYDTTVAVWDSKYAYNRPRPTEVDATLGTAIPSPASPSYPSEHAAVAGAAQTVLAYLFPDDADALGHHATEAAQSRVEAGVQFPSDTAVGLDLGHKVGELVVQRGRQDGSAVAWDGQFSTIPGAWSLDGYPDGAAPVAPTFGTLQPWVLESGKQVRPGPLPAPGTDQKQAELEEVRDFPRTFVTNAVAMYWQSPRSDWILLADDRIAQYHLDANPPRAARVDALVSVAAFDAAVACWDAKYTYWAARPFNWIQTCTPYARYPCTPATRRPTVASPGLRPEYLRRCSPPKPSTSRLWAGVHFRSDIDAGLALGRAVGDLVTSRAQRDGS
jgi:membrane-associated phospholipid phosphatase